MLQLIVVNDVLLVHKTLEQGCVEELWLMDLICGSYGGYWLNTNFRVNHHFEIRFYEISSHYIEISSCCNYYMSFETSLRTFCGPNDG